MSGADGAESTKRFLNSIGCSGEIPSLPIGANLDIPLTGAPAMGSVPPYTRVRFDDLKEYEAEKRDPHRCPDDFMRQFIDRTHDFLGSYDTNEIIDHDDEAPYTEEPKDPERYSYEDARAEYLRTFERTRRNPSIVPMRGYGLGPNLTKDGLARIAPDLSIPPLRDDPDPVITGIYWEGDYILRDRALEIKRDTARFRRILDRRYAAYLNQDDDDITPFELMTEFMGSSVSMFDPMEALKEYCKDNPGAEEAFKGILAMGNRSSETKSPSMIGEPPKECAVSNQTSVPTNPPSLLPQYNRRERRERGARNKKR
jgi:hypothetical protein